MEASLKRERERAKLTSQYKKTVWNRAKQKGVKT